jgi:hypothetical protein
MFDPIDILCGVIILAFFAYILIDSYISAKKQKKRYKERNEQRVKEGKEPIDWENMSVGGGLSESEAAEKRDFFRRMGGISGI